MREETKSIVVSAITAVVCIGLLQVFEDHWPKPPPPPEEIVIQEDPLPVRITNGADIIMTLRRNSSVDIIMDGAVVLRITAKGEVLYHGFVIIPANDELARWAREWNQAMREAL